MFLILLLSFITNTDKQKATGEQELTELINSICDIESSTCAFTYTDGVVSGVAVVYSGSNSSYTCSRIYELISTLYDLPYCRIYVCHE